MMDRANFPISVGGSRTGMMTWLYSVFPMTSPVQANHQPSGHRCAVGTQKSIDYRIGHRALYNWVPSNTTDAVVRVAERYRTHLNICLLTVDFLELLEPGDSGLMITESYLNHPEFIVRKKAVYNLLREEEYGRMRLVKCHRRPGGCPD